MLAAVEVLVSIKSFLNVELHSQGCVDLARPGVDLAQPGVRALD
jgi:hypothetical protein